MEGKITMSEGIAQLDNLDFNLLAGGFLMSGFYNSNPPLPLFNFNFKISSMSIKETFSSFNTIQEMAPMAKDLAGVFFHRIRYGWGVRYRYDAGHGIFIHLWPYRLGVDHL